MKKETAPFARNLALIMKQRGLTLRAVADMAGVSVSSVSDWLNNSKPTDYMKVAQLARRLGLGFEWLLTGQDGPVPAPLPSMDELFEAETASEIDGVWRIKAVRLKVRGRS